MEAETAVAEMRLSGLGHSFLIFLTPKVLKFYNIHQQVLNVGYFMDDSRDVLERQFAQRLLSRAAADGRFKRLRK